MKCFIFYSLIFACMCFNCKKKIQPSSASSEIARNIEKKILENNSHSLATQSLLKQLNNIEDEFDSLYGQSNHVKTDNGISVIEDAITKLSASLFMEKNPDKIFSAISDLLYNNWQIVFEENEKDPNAIFPERVIANRRGTCLGMSLLVLVICEKLGFPVYGVIAPGHFFVRFDNGSTKRNFETLRRGESMTDTWYRMRWSIKDTIRYPLENCSINDVISAIHYTLGNTLKDTNKYDAAISYYKKAISKNPDLIEAFGNMAIVYDILGDRNQAINILDALVKKYPDFENVHSNLATLLLKESRFKEAETEYKRALNDDPKNASLYLGLAVTCLSTKQCSESKNAILKALEINPRYVDALQFEVAIDSTCN